MTPDQVVRHLIRDVVKLGYTAATLGVPLEQAQDEAAGELADRVVAATISAVRQVGSS